MNGLPSPLRSMTFSGTDLQRSDLSLHLDLVSGLNDGVEVRGRDTVIPGLSGVVPRSRVKGARFLQLVGDVFGAGATEDDRLDAAQTILDELETLFDPTMSPADLEGDARDGSTRTIACRPEAGPIFEEGEVPGVYRVSVSLVAPDPDWSIA